jgi:hypothetical protein
MQYLQPPSPIMLQSVRMDYSQSVPLYQDRPRYGLVLRLILLLPVALAIPGVCYWAAGEAAPGSALLAEALVIGLIFWFVFPREYRVYEDHLRIVLGGPFSVKVGFENLKAVRVTSKTSWSVNFVTRITRSYVEIARKKGPGIAITPTVLETFVQEANRALTRWAATKSSKSDGDYPLP